MTIVILSIVMFIVQDTSLFADSVKTYVPIWVSSLKMAINSNLSLFCRRINEKKVL